MTFVRYIVPLIVEANKQGIDINVFVGKSSRHYNCAKTNISYIKELSEEYNFKLFDIDEIKNHTGPILLCEDCGTEVIGDLPNKTYSLLYMSDFFKLYDSYVDKVDHVIFPSKFVAEYYNKISDKNLYLGCPKYDYETKNRNELLQKYKLDENQYALVVFPRRRDLGQINLDVIYGYLKNMGFKIIVKTRGKDPVHEKQHQGDHYYMDYSWYPHDTIELMNLSEVVINFGSTTVKECVMTKTPLIDFNIKPKHITRDYDFLYDYSYCKVLKSEVSFDDFSNSIKQILKTPVEIYDDVINKYLFTGNSSKKILDLVIQE
jgi:hypothetical protein